MRVWTASTKPSRFKRHSGWPSIAVLVVGFLAQGPVAVAVVDAFSDETVPAAAYKAAAVANILLLAISAAISAIFAFCNLDEFLTVLTGFIVVVVTSLGAVIGSVAAGARAFGLRASALLRLI